MKECTMCGKNTFRETTWPEFTCTQCHRHGIMQKRCHVCKALSDINESICPRCGNPDIVDCFVQHVGRLTPKGERAVNKLQVESLLEEINNN